MACYVGKPCAWGGGKVISVPHLQGGSRFNLSARFLAPSSGQSCMAVPCSCALPPPPPHPISSLSTHRAAAEATHPELDTRHRPARRAPAPALHVAGQHKKPLSTLQIPGCIAWSRKANSLATALPSPNSKAARGSAKSHQPDPSFPFSLRQECIYLFFPQKTKYTTDNHGYQHPSSISPAPLPRIQTYRGKKSVYVSCISYLSPPVLRPALLNTQVIQRAELHRFP